MADRCDLTELLVTDCAHCRRLPELDVREPEPRHQPDGYGGPTVIAEYGGRCVDCGEPVRPGEPITLTEDGWVGQCCAEVA